MNTVYVALVSIGFLTFVEVSADPAPPPPSYQATAYASLMERASPPPSFEFSVDDLYTGEFATGDFSGGLSLGFPSNSSATMHSGPSIMVMHMIDKNVDARQPVLLAYEHSAQDGSVIWQVAYEASPAPFPHAMVDSIPLPWESAPSTLPISGYAMYYNAGVMQEVFYNRLAMGHVSICNECIGLVALLRAGDLNRRVWLQWEDGKVEGPFLVVDVAAAHHVPSLLARNWVVDVDYDTALRRGIVAPVFVTVWESPPTGVMPIAATAVAPILVPTLEVSTPEPPTPQPPAPQPPAPEAPTVEASSPPSPLPTVTETPRMPEPTAVPTATALPYPYPLEPGSE